MKGEATSAVFYVLILIALIMIIANAPILDVSKKYFYYVFAILFMYTPILILKHW
jgi:hypothetical protein